MGGVPERYSELGPRHSPLESFHEPVKRLSVSRQILVSLLESGQRLYPQVCPGCKSSCPMRKLPRVSAKPEDLYSQAAWKDKERFGCCACVNYHPLPYTVISIILLKHDRCGPGPAQCWDTDSPSSNPRGISNSFPTHSNRDARPTAILPEIFPFPPSSLILQPV